jgi:hypothetical protein
MKWKGIKSTQMERERNSTPVSIKAKNKVNLIFFSHPCFSASEIHTNSLPTDSLGL